MKNIVLSGLFLHIPDSKGKFRQVSMAEVIENQCPHEIAFVRQWFANHVFVELGYKPNDMEITEEAILKSLELMEHLKIQPQECFYIGKDDDNEDHK